MKTIFKKISAAAASAMLAVCSAGVNYSYGADTKETPTYKVHYELGEGVTIAPDDDGNVPEINDEVKAYNSAVFMPTAELEKEGYYFSGWTADDIYGYPSGKLFRVPDHDVTVTPVWTKKGDTSTHTVKFSIEIDGEVREDYEKMVGAQKRVAGSFVEIPMNVFPRDGYKQSGWTDGTNLFAGQQYIIVHDEDIILYPNWKKIYKITYTVGDADRINGTTFQEYEFMEGGEIELQANNRFSRNGFNIIGWHCETDGKDYLPNQKFIMPGSDVVITPIWEPITYTIVFDAKLTSKDDIRVKGQTDTSITVPECKAVKEGYTFSGWQFEDKIYQPGDEYLIVGAKPGVGISFKAVWKTADAEDTTTTTTTETSTTTTEIATTTTTVSETAPVSTTTVSVKPYSYVVKVIDKDTKELVNDAHFVAAWSIKYEIDGQEFSSGPLTEIKTSEANPTVLSFENHKDAKECGLEISSMSENENYTFNAEDIQTENDEENNIRYITVNLTKKSAAADIAYGDANRDGGVDMADIVLIMQSLANPDKYDISGSDPSHITAEGRKNADVFNPGDGMTVEDALHIQKYLLGLCELTAKVTTSELPE